MYSFIFLLSVFGFIFQEIPSAQPDPPLSLKLKDGGFVFVESNRKVVFLIDKEGTVKWISRELEKKKDFKAIDLLDAAGAMKKGLNEPGGLSLDHIYIFTRSYTTREHPRSYMFALKDGKCIFMGSD